MTIDTKQLTLAEAQEHFDAQPSGGNALVVAQVAERLWLADELKDEAYMACIATLAPYLDVTVTKIMEKRRG